MRKIIPKQIEAKKNKRKQLIIGGILVAIMILSTVGYAINSGGDSTEAEKITYSGIEFVQQNGYWFATIGEVEFAFKYNPKETEGISAPVTLAIGNYDEKSLYVSSDNTNVETELYRSLDSVILRRQYACLEGETCTNNYPLKTCDDNFIIIKESNNSQIKQDKNCVFIEGKGEDMIKLADRFLYKILGIQ